MPTLPQYRFPAISRLPVLLASDRRRRIVFVASREPNPLELVGPMNVLKLTNWVLEHSGRPDLGYDLEVVASQPGVIFEIDGLKIVADKPYHRLRGEVDTLRTEHEALEGLLDETLGDLSQRDEEVRELHRQLKRQNKTVAAEGRQADQRSRRLGTLYKNIEIDDNAVKDLIALRDESLKLKAEEALKHLSDESDQVAVRRKVGGLPPFLSILELGYAGKGRVYYTKGAARRFRILRVGTKASQKPDIEYLSRLPRGT